MPGPSNAGGSSTAGGATRGSGSGRSTKGSGKSGERGGSRTDRDEHVSWSLPGGDLSVDDVGFCFNELRAGRCPTVTPDTESVFLSHGQHLLYRAATAVCAGDLAAARGPLAGARLTDHLGDCRLYTAVVSVLEQRPQASITCPAPERTSATAPTTPAPARRRSRTGRTPGRARRPR